MSSAHENML